jgi:Xaa-Pro aminopeptidase
MHVHVPFIRLLSLLPRFTGSAGTVIVSRSGAHLFTDSRYWIQATRELDSNWTLHKVGLPGIQPWNVWVKERPRGSRIGVDSRLVSHGQFIPIDRVADIIVKLIVMIAGSEPDATETATALSSGLHARYSKLVFPRVNLIDKIWKSRPAKSQEHAFFLDLKFTGTFPLPTYTPYHMFPHCSLFSSSCSCTWLYITCFRSRKICF